MSLRVLIADKSTSIDRVFRLGLQDLGAGVKSVQNGLDVLPMAESYQPHIIFADILLQKKNGYEISKELNQNQKTKHIPVVLMWSPFMELDQKEYQNCGAKAELEKPFEIEVMLQTLNSLVKESQGQSVSESSEFPDVQDQNISEFLDFPEKIKTNFIQKEESHGMEEDKEDMKNNSDFLFIPDQKDQQKEEEKEEEEQQPVDKESILAQSFEKFKPHEPMDMDESHSFFNLEVEQDSDPNEVMETDSDQFQPMDLKADKELELEDFIFQMDSDKTPSPDIYSKTKSASDSLPPSVVNSSPPSLDLHEKDNQETKKPKNMEKPQISISPPYSESQDEDLQVEDFGEKVPSASQKSTHWEQSPLPPEARFVLEKAIKDQLPGIMEKVVREELEKIFKQEIALKKSSKN